MTLSRPRNGGLIDLFTTVVHYDGDNTRSYDGAKTRVGTAASATVKPAPELALRYNVKITPRHEKPKTIAASPAVERFELVFRQPVKPLLAKQVSNGMTVP
jgi:hypothetical protein